MAKISSIVDVPKKAEADDLFGINKYEKGLIQFIENSDTPITIAIQGEWGSGKTSLMNSLQKQLCGGALLGDDFKMHNADFYGIWINTWQYSLLKDPAETLISIVTSISTQIVQIIEARHKTDTQKLVKSIWGMGSKILKGGVGVAVESMAGERAADVVGSLFEREEASRSLQHLRNELQAAINECLTKDVQANSGKKGFLFFIDDLDRIDPPVAVQILELLKNIFDLENCIFILAIDYDVVIKGLKPKFGELTDSNEREFRSFFDKIIQMPFSMPVANYTIDDFLISSLKKIEFIASKNESNKELASTLTNLCQLSVGSNPRSLKRLLNTVSLITIIAKEDADQEADEETINNIALNFGLICIQIAYPQIYKVLCMESDFKTWNEAIATRLNLGNLSASEVAKLDATTEFDEEWEKVIFRICEKDAYLRSKSVQISTMLNTMAQLVPEGASLGDTIEELLSLSSVTDVQAFDKPKLAINKGPILKNFSSKILPLLKEYKPDAFKVVRQQSKKVMSNVYISYSPKNWNECIRFTVSTGNDKINLLAIYHQALIKMESSNMHNDFKNAGLGEELKTIISKYEALGKSASCCTFKNPGMSSIGSSRGWHVPHINFQFQFVNPDEMLSEEKLTQIAKIVSESMAINAELKALAERYSENLKTNQ
jgi:transcriptional regulator